MLLILVDVGGLDPLVPSPTPKELGTNPLKVSLKVGLSGGLRKFLPSLWARSIVASGPTWPKMGFLSY